MNFLARNSAAMTLTRVLRPPFRYACHVKMTCGHLSSLAATWLLIISAFLTGVARTQTGTLDPTFTASSNWSLPTVYAMALQPDGKILAGGSFGTNGTP